MALLSVKGVYMPHGTDSEKNIEFTEDTALRNKIHVFKDRTQAGKLLAKALEKYNNKDAIILAIPSGGVPVGYVAAENLNLAAFDVIIVRKIQIPWNPEAGFGAISLDGTIVLNKPLVDVLGLNQEMIDKCASETMKEIQRRIQKFRDDRPFPDLNNKIVILVDDGLASGFTMIAAINSVRKQKPKKVVVAVPTAPLSTIKRLFPYVDELICLNVRDFRTFAVADAYFKWYDLDDEEVLEYLRKAFKKQKARLS